MKLASLHPSATSNVLSLGTPVAIDTEVRTHGLGIHFDPIMMAFSLTYRLQCPSVALALVTDQLFKSVDA